MARVSRNDRRRFLRQSGGFTLAFSIPLGTAWAQPASPSPAKPRLPGSLERNRRLDAWIRIQPADQSVLLMVGKVELGQGILTALAQLCADELEVNIERVRIVAGDTALVPNEGTTAGSFSMPDSGTAVRHAAAEVRAALLELAGKRLGVSVDGLRVDDATVIAASGARVTYWELPAGEELRREATGKVPPRRSGYRYIGRSVPRVDLTPKILGQSMFVHELRPEGLLYGRVVRPTTYRARLIAADTAAVERMPGVVKVVRDGSFLGVIARRESQADAAAEALARACRWDTPAALPRTDGVEAWLRSAPIARDIPTRRQPRTTPGEVVRTLEATYFRPFQMHASIGPSAALATLGVDGTLVVQTHSQSVFETATAIAAMLGMPRERVRLQHVQGAGCYGHNLADDAAADAALLAVQVPGRPVRLQYSREQEHRWEPYGSAMLIRARAGLDAKGDVLDWNLELWSLPHTTRPGNQPGNLLSATYLAKPFAQPVPVNNGPPNFAADRNAVALYDFPGHDVLTHFITEMPVRVSAHRGLGAYANVFAIESFMDELAQASGSDPVDYRLRHLKDPRARDAIRAAAERFGWATWKRAPGRGRGIAFARYKNIAGYCAVALEVEVDARSGNIRVLRAVASADSGEIVSPDGVINQIEGGLVQSLSWTLKEEVRMDDTRILSEDWASYPILAFSEVPPVDVVLLDRPGQPFLGTGEASQGPTGAALANAVFDATGVRFRRLPLTPARVLEGLKNRRV